MRIAPDETSDKPSTADTVNGDSKLLTHKGQLWFKVGMGSHLQTLF